MVAIVIVAHSAQLAEGVRELANQMVQGRVHIVAAGGIDDPIQPFGTDAIQIQQAIESVYSDEGVVVLMDLGSAVLSAEAALEFLSEEKRAHVYLCEAPLVEGSIAAAVQASTDSTPHQVMAEARGALAAKIAHLQPSVPATPETATPALYEPQTITPPVAAEEIRLVVRNQMGLHARPAAQFVSTAAQFQSQISLRNISRASGPASAKSINMLAILGVRQGHEIAVTASGPDARQALAALKALVEANFGETDAPLYPAPRPAVTQPAKKGELHGVPASPGIAIGPLLAYRPTHSPVQERVVEDSQAEWGRLQAAIRTAHADIQVLRARASGQVGDYEAAIFDAHLLILQDPALLEAVHQGIFEHKLNAEAAWQAEIEHTADAYRALDDAYLQARAVDVSDVGQRVLCQLMGIVPSPFTPSEPAILVARDLTPSDTAQLDASLVLGICTELGGPTSHSAILARALGIPAVVGLGAQIMSLPDGDPLALNGESGQVWIKPTSKQQAMLQARREAWLEKQRTARMAGQQAAITQDGQLVEVVANIRGLVDAQLALDYGAEGVGLLRTEFLYLERQTTPSEEEQLAAYQAIADVMETRPLIVRTMDVGGDKPLPYLELEPEDNPFLGWRAIRLCLDRPELLKTQVRAILRASPGHNLKLMFPMIATLTELRAARQILAEAQAELRRDGLAFDPNMEVGIMVEIPAAVTMAGRLAAEVDFFSIGSNDLSQYTMAADRTNARVAGLASAFQPAVLSMIHQTIQAAHAAGIWVGLCGELAGDPLAAPILLGLGLDEFSMNAPAIPQVKHIIRHMTVERARRLAQQALGLDSADQVRQEARAYLEELGCL